MNTIDEMDDDQLDDQIVLLIEVKLEPKINLIDRINQKLTN